MAAFHIDPVVERLRELLRVRAPRREEVPGFRPAAVLVPLIARGGAAHVVFTLRSAELSTHSGQVSFPGGKVDEGDADHVAAALREAKEEVGLEPRQVEVIGTLDDVVTPSRFVIRPVLARVADEAVFHPSFEVAETFDLPLADLARPGVYRDMGDVVRDGRTYRLVAFELSGRNIWGATARVVAQLLRLLEAQELAEA